jgi:hypothetical protein
MEKGCWTPQNLSEYNKHHHDKISINDQPSQIESSCTATTSQCCIDFKNIAGSQ